jgi:hypothetical protein
MRHLAADPAVMGDQRLRGFDRTLTAATITIVALSVATLAVLSLR